MAVLLFVACYAPPDYVHPAPAEVTMHDVLSGEVGDGPGGGGAAADDEAAPDEDDGDAEPANDGDAEPADDGDAEPAADGDAEPAAEANAAEAASDFQDQPVRPYTAFTLRTPLSIVDDAGQPVAVIAKPGTEVEVIAEGELRVKVRCTGCSPVVEGYLQADAVQR